jgi:hypothetical protein
LWEYKNYEANVLNVDKIKQQQSLKNMTLTEPEGRWVIRDFGVERKGYCYMVQYLW